MLPIKAVAKKLSKLRQTPIHKMKYKRSTSQNRKDGDVKKSKRKFQKYHRFWVLFG